MEELIIRFNHWWCNGIYVRKEQNWSGQDPPWTLRKNAVFRVKKITYHKKHGPLLVMVKCELGWVHNLQKELRPAKYEERLKVTLREARNQEV